jgi:putative protease
MVKLHEDFHAKDGIGIQTRTRMLGSAVNVMKRGEERIESAKAGETVIFEISSKTGKSVDIGNKLYLTTDRHLLNRLQKTDLKTSPVNIKVTARKDDKLKIEIKRTTGEAEGVVFEDDYIVQQAMKAPTTEEKIKTIDRCTHKCKT